MIGSYAVGITFGLLAIVLFAAAIVTKDQ